MPSPCILRLLSVSALDCSSSPVFQTFHLSSFVSHFAPSSTSFPAISFADPHPLTLLESYRFKNVTGRGRLQPSDTKAVTFSPPLRFHKSFRCNTYRHPRKCCKQKTYGIAKPFRCNTYKKHGGGDTLCSSSPTFRRLDVPTIPYPPKSLPLN